MKKLIVGILLVTFSLPSFAKDYKTRIDDFVSEDDVARISSVMRKARAGDTVYINLTGPGGYSDSTQLITKSMRGTKAKIIGQVNGMAYSAAAFLLLEVDQIQGYGQIMYHIGNAPPGTQEYYYALSVCKRVLTKKEMKRIYNYEDVFLPLSEVKRRLGK